ncbi:hypothetical protein D7Z26_00295 [Cohnella endophytica]|uniref:Lipoprotein n=1 Tax=Cohnella endophytica TaxID=2419778 RepID=A0A494Y5M9_9BACL|nr:hypothetical protein [Cohnella endophytica]RKP57990.1 hypothetical protein D7Z26_00295 [Cohnella endophytica]
MRRVGALLFLFILAVSGLVGCNHSAELYAEVNPQSLNKKVKDFADILKDRNGLFLYTLVGEKNYLIVNYSNVNQGEEANFLESINAKVQDHTLIININVLGTQDYQDKRLGSMRVFSLASANKYEKIQIFKNGIETSFDAAGG